MKKIEYTTSTDYKRLHDLLSQRKEIVCFVDYQNICMDVCAARCMAEDDRIMIGARGIEYGDCLHLHEVDRFVDDCENMKLQFIDIAS